MAGVSNFAQAKFLPELAPIKDILMMPNNESYKQNILASQTPSSLRSGSGGEAHMTLQAQTATGVAAFEVNVSEIILPLGWAFPTRRNFPKYPCSFSFLPPKLIVAISSGNDKFQSGIKRGKGKSWTTSSDLDSAADWLWKKVTSKKNLPRTYTAYTAHFYRVSLLPSREHQASPELLLPVRFERGNWKCRSVCTTIIDTLPSGKDILRLEPTAPHLIVCKGLLEEIEKRKPYIGSQ